MAERYILVHPVANLSVAMLGDGYPPSSGGYYALASPLWYWVTSLLGPPRRSPPSTVFSPSTAGDAPTGRLGVRMRYDEERASQKPRSQQPVGEEDGERGIRMLSVGWCGMSVEMESGGYKRAERPSRRSRNY